MHCHVQKRRGVSLVTITIARYNWAKSAETAHAFRHPPGNVFLCVTVGALLHVRACKAMVVPDLKNGWTNCAQIWYTDRDQLLGCRESQLEEHPHARLSPPKGVLLAVDVHRYVKIQVIYQKVELMPKT